METSVYITLGISGFLGVLAHILVKYRDSVSKKVKMDWKAHILNGLFGFFTIGILLWFGDEVNPIYPLEKLTVFMAGYMTDSVWKNITKFGADKLKL